MGADAFIAIYGVNIAISQIDQDTLQALEARTDSRLRNARQHGLDVCWGHLTDGADYFLYVGYRIGLLGVENDTYVQVPLDKLNETATKVQVRLNAAGFVNVPRYTSSWKPNIETRLLLLA